MQMIFGPLFLLNNIITERYSGNRVSIAIAVLFIGLFGLSFSMNYNYLIYETDIIVVSFNSGLMRALYIFVSSLFLQQTFNKYLQIKISNKECIWLFIVNIWSFYLDSQLFYVALGLNVVWLFKSSYFEEKTTKIENFIMISLVTMSYILNSNVLYEYRDNLVLLLIFVNIGLIYVQISKTGINSYSFINFVMLIVSVVFLKKLINLIVLGEVVKTVVISMPILFIITKKYSKEVLSLLMLLLMSWSLDVLSVEVTSLLIAGLYLANTVPKKIAVLKSKSSTVRLLKVFTVITLIMFPLVFGMNIEKGMYVYPLSLILFVYVVHTLKKYISSWFLDVKSNNRIVFGGIYILLALVVRMVEVL